MIHLLNDTSDTDLDSRHTRFGELNDSLKKNMDAHSKLMVQLKQISHDIDRDMSEMMQSTRGGTAAKKMSIARGRAGSSKGTPNAA